MGPSFSIAPKNACGAYKEPNSVGFFPRELHPAREAVHYFAAVPPVNGPYKLNGFACAQEGRAREAEHGRFFGNAQQARFFLRGKRSFRDLICKIDLKAVVLEQALIERHL